MNHLKAISMAVSLLLCSVVWARGNVGTPNGQPFTHLQEQIDQINQELDDLAESVGVTLSQLQADVSGLQSQIDDLNSELASKQDVLDPSGGCAVDMLSTPFTSAPLPCACAPSTEPYGPSVPSDDPFS